MTIFDDITKNLVSDPTFWEAHSIVSQNCNDGRVWLVGGYLYRTLADLLFRIGKPEVDFDFIVESPKEDIILPAGWNVKENRYGNPKFVGSYEIDFVPLATVESITRRKLEPTIDNYLTGTPLTVQSIAYDFLTEKLIGKIGMSALVNRTVAVNNKEQAEIYAQRKDIPIENIIKKKAGSMGFIAAYSK